MKRTTGQIIGKMIAAALREIPDYQSYEGWAMTLTNGEYITQPSQLADAFSSGLVPSRAIEAAIRELRFQTQEAPADG